MVRSFSIRRTGLIGGLVVVMVLAAGAWVKRTPLLAWYYVHKLARAEDGERAAWAERAAGLDGAIVPGLIGCLREEGRGCVNAQAALACLMNRWEPADPRRAALVGRLGEAAPTLSLAGQQAVLELETTWLEAGGNSPTPIYLLQTGFRLLSHSVQASDRETRSRALGLAAIMLGKTGQKEVVAICRQLAALCLKDDDPANRVRAVELALRPGIGLLGNVVPMLNDPAPEVRRIAMIGVGPVAAVIATDDLLHWLHDPDGEVCHLCEKALRGRGLNEENLRLARLKSDADPRVRLKVLDYLAQATDLDPGVWLRSLSHDEAPAVRAAVIRVAAEQTNFDLTDRLEQMAKDDPSPTIRQVARHYLNYPKSQPQVAGPEGVSLTHFSGN